MLSDLSLKVEGRMKNILYTATMARAYKKAIDTYFNDPDEYDAILPELVISKPHAV